MGYAIVMFGILLITSAIVVTAYDYGVAKDSQIMPLKAENIYADRETEKTHTSLTIVNTCLKPDDSNKDRYVKPGDSSETYSGPYSLYLTVRNNRSVILNSTDATVLYNTSYKNFTITDWDDRWHDWEEHKTVLGDGEHHRNPVCGHHDDDHHQNDLLLPPLTYVCMKASNINITTPDTPLPNPEIRLAVAAQNGITTIAPTTPTNFTARKIDSNSVNFSWNASYDADGLIYYRLYIMHDSDVGDCNEHDDDHTNVLEIPGNATYYLCNSCDQDYYYLTAVDKFYNEGVQSRTLKCKDVSNGQSCIY